MNPSKTNPTDVIREAVRVELARRRMTQTELAERLGTSRQHLSKAMLGGTSDLPQLWRDALSELGLELKVTLSSEAVDEESAAWLNADLSNLGAYEPYDWGDEDPETLGKSVAYVPGEGLLVEE